jgi:glycosyltransferase involved in cell wall biosynthesis
MSAPGLALPDSHAADGAAMAASDAVVRTIEAAAERFSARGAHEDAAACAQVGATIGWMNHPGRFASARLERVLREGAAAMPPVPYARRAGTGDPQRVLHVLSEGYETGGHTRLAWRWMLQDAGRTHALAFTRHRPVPPSLQAAVAQRGGGPADVPAPTATLMERAERIRAVAAGFDLVLLHVHPDDPVPSLAFAGQRERPPIAFVNHADHLLWLGREAADVVVNNRDIARRISAERRGISAERNLLLPLPLQGVAAGGDREAARHELGIAPDQVLLLTVGSDYKFGPIGGAHFLDAAEPVVAAHPQALLLAVGPPAEGRFAEAGLRTAGRVRALGVLPDLGRLYAAADAYLESYPCSSGTAVREAAAHGVPVVTFAPDPIEAEMVGSDASLASVWQRAETVDEYEEIVAELIDDPDARARWGAAARESVANARDDGRWVEDVEDVYRRALAVGPATAAELRAPSEERTGHDTIVHRIHALTGKQIAMDRAEAVANQLELVSRSRAARVAFEALVGPDGGPRQVFRYPVALAAPVADRAVVGALVDEFRLLGECGLVERFTMAVPPALVDDVVPLVETALDSGADVDIDLVTLDDPLAAAMPGTLLVLVAGDAFGELPGAEYPHQHLAA